jgi:hypothetical protein
MSDQEVRAADGIDEVDGTTPIAAFSTTADGGHEVDAASVVRIEHDLQVSWSGVHGCCSDDRPQREVTSSFNRWVGEQIAAHPGMAHLGSGHGGGEARCSSSNSGWPDNRRSCRGGVIVKAFIEFAPR